MMSNVNGISVIVCCFNSSILITETLQSLIHQFTFKLMSFELIIIDNNSTDNTSEIVKSVLEKYTVNYTILNEGKQGLIFAREKGIKFAKYDLLLFCDDDNRLRNDYLEKVYNIMVSDLTIGACGGRGVPILNDVVEPTWFAKYSSAFALGSQVKNNGTVTQLYGAGVCIRKSSLELLYKSGFKPFCKGRKGKTLLAGEDTELTSALRLLNFKLYADDHLVFYHYLPSFRINENYLLKMYRGFGIAYVINFIYLNELKNTNIKSIYELFFVSLLRVLLNMFKTDIDKRVKYSYNLGILRGFFLYNFDIVRVFEVIKTIKTNSKNALND